RYPEVEGSASLVVRALDYEQVDVQWTVESNDGNEAALRALLIVRPRANQAAIAPASAWLARIGDRARQSKFIMDCIDCHQVPSSEVRNYAGLIADQHATNPQLAREQSWNTIVKYMNYLSAWEFSRGRRDPEQKVDTDAVYSVDNGAETAALLAEIFDHRLDAISGYTWGGRVGEPYVCRRRRHRGDRSTRGAVGRSDEPALASPRPGRLAVDHASVQRRRRASRCRAAGVAHVAPRHGRRPDPRHPRPELRL